MPPSAIDGASPSTPTSPSRRNRLGRVLRYVRASLTVKLVVTIVVFAALPVVLYGQFEEADRKMRDLVTNGIAQQSWLIAQALKPMLDGDAMPDQAALDAELGKYAADGTTLDLMLRPDQDRSSRGIYYIASAAIGGRGRSASKLDELLANGILGNLADSCTSGVPSELRYVPTGSHDEMLTWVRPIQSRRGCWALVYSHPASEFLNTSVARPYWRTREVRVTAAIYLAVVALALFIAASVMRSIRIFRETARATGEDRDRARSFAAANAIPELASVAGDFDRLVGDLFAAARDIRQAAEDNAHSFKGPIATIAASLEPLRRLAATSDARARRSLQLVESSLARLQVLIGAAQRVDNVTANLIDTPRVRVNVSQLISNTLARYRELLASRDIVLSEAVADNIGVYAGTGMIETVFENILDNAISVSPPHSIVWVKLRKSRELADVSVEDQGPGIDPRKISQMFERYVSVRPKIGNGASAPHSGLGLWIVRRNVENLGGRVIARNRDEGGFSIHVVLPLDHGRKKVVPKAVRSELSAQPSVPAIVQAMPPIVQGETRDLA